MWQTGVLQGVVSGVLLALSHPILRLVIDNVRVKRRVFARMEAVFFHLFSMALESTRVIGNHQKSENTDQIADVHVQHWCLPFLF